MERLMDVWKSSEVNTWTSCRKRIGKIPDVCTGRNCIYLYTHIWKIDVLYTRSYIYSGRRNSEEATFAATDYLYTKIWRIILKLLCTQYLCSLQNYVYKNITAANRENRVYFFPKIRPICPKTPFYYTYVKIIDAGLCCTQMLLYKN